MKRLRTITLSVLLISLLLVMSGCGGGSGGSSGGGGGNPPGQLQITNPSILPGTLQGHAYSVTLQAINGVGALTWSIAPISPTAMFVDGLSINPNTGVLSGTANFAGTGGFVATVTDSKSRSVQKSFTITAGLPLTVANSKSVNIFAYTDPIYFSPDYQDGVPPFTFAVTGGSLPPGLHLDPSSGYITGATHAPGTYVANITITDGFSPPESGTQQLTITVKPPGLSLNPSLPNTLPLNRPFSGKIIATGGTPPYAFSIVTGSLPPGLDLTDPGAGTVSGTPTSAGYYSVFVSATDSSIPVQTAYMGYTMSVAAPLGRNDTVQTATPLLMDGMYGATISPYIDPPNTAPLPGDQDYYKVISMPGSIVHAETFASRWNSDNPIDTVLEIVDANGVQHTTCRLPGDNSNNYTSNCLNDDIGGSPYTVDSSLDFQVPGQEGTPTTFYVHVLDWRGDARPDMNYDISLRGILSQLVITTPSLLPGTNGRNYSQYLASSGGTPPVSWTVTSGSLPPGISMTSTGAFSGTFTTNGTYSFTVQATDSGTPAQTATAQFTVQVVDPVQITSSPNLPDGCLNQPYSFAMQAAGGLPPYNWTFYAWYWPPGIVLNTATGAFSGTPTLAGSFSAIVTVGDATFNGASQTLTLNINNCP